MKNEKINDGGPAFPGVAGVSGYGNSVPMERPNGETAWVEHNQGLSVRDYFAAKVMQAILTLERNVTALALNQGWDRTMAKNAFAMADTMIVERNKYLPADKPTCRWTYDEHTSSWDTQCDEKFQFSHEGIKENGAKFCQYCGGQIIEIANKSQAES